MTMRFVLPLYQGLDIQTYKDLDCTHSMWKNLKWRL